MDPVAAKYIGAGLACLGPGGNQRDRCGTATRRVGSSQASRATSRCTSRDQSA